MRNARVMRRALAYAADFDALVMHYAEDPDLADGGRDERGRIRHPARPAGIPREAEAIMLDRDIRLVELTGARYHAALVSTTLSLDVIAKAKAAGLPITCGDVDQSSDAERERHRRLPHLPEAGAAAAA